MAFTRLVTAWNTLKLDGQGTLVTCKVKKSVSAMFWVG
jgi:hypothetical protein